LGLKEPWAVAVDPAGNVYVSDQPFALVFWVPPFGSLVVD